MSETPAEAAGSESEPKKRKRPRPGERREQILQVLAGMLEQPGAERITTAALAARLEVSEAALYRHFASKAQMFEGLIEFIESSVFALVNQITEREPSGAVQAQRIVAMLLQFGEKNPGMTRVMVGDALVFENERLTQRMNHNGSQGNGAGWCKSCHDSATRYAGSMDRKTLRHEAGSSTVVTDCSQSGCHRPLGNKGAAYTKWD